MKRFGFGMRMWQGAELRFKDVFDAKDEAEAKSKIGNWMSRHGLCRDDAELMEVPEYARNFESAKYMVSM